MFLVNDSLTARRKKIVSFLNDSNAPIAVLLAAANFEWVTGRAILNLGTEPNKQIRERLSKTHGLDAYKKLWRDQVANNIGGRDLPQIAREWDKFKRAYNLRHELIHGRGSCSLIYATSRVECILRVTDRIVAICKENNVDLNQRTKVRRKSR